MMEKSNGNEEEQIQIQSSRQSSNTYSRNLKAYMLSILSSLCMVLSQIQLKRLGRYFESSYILAMRGSLLFIGALLYIIYKKKSLNVSNPAVFRSIIKRVFFNSLTVIMYLGSIKYLPIGIVNSLFNTLPIMIFFVEAIYYKKKNIQWINLVLIILSFLGVLLIIQPSFLFGGFNPEHYLRYFIVLLGALMGSFSMLFLHDLRGKVQQIIVLQYGYFFQCIINTVLFFISEHETKALVSEQKTLINLFQLGIQVVLMVFFGFLTQYLTAVTVYMCEPALVMPFLYFTVVFGFLIDHFFFKIEYNSLKIIGMCLASLGLFLKFVSLYWKKGEKK